MTVATSKPVGLVLGKFYPPHAGHHFLIDTAAQACHTLYVLVTARDDETITLNERMSWLSDAHAHQKNVVIIGAKNNVPVNYNDPDIWAAHTAIFTAAVSSYQARPVTHLFTSEDYGDELAYRMGLTHVLIDLPREIIPISATRVRANPLGAQNLLRPATRAGLTRRIVVLGAESTGTSTVAEALAAKLRTNPLLTNTRSVPEYGHELSFSKLLTTRGLARASSRPIPEMADVTWDDSDFITVATEQNRLEDLAARDSGLLLICDTDAYTTSLWQQRYLGHVTREVRSLGRYNDLYLLTHHEGVPFVQDGTRDGEHLRRSMTTIFENDLLTTNRNYVVLRGSLSERLAIAEAAIQSLLARGWWPHP